jgi:hypothetical protein
MPGRANQFDQAVAMTKVIEIAPNAIALKAHVRQIIESPAFKGSRRGQEFLQFIVDRALENQFDHLKERALGVELFGRPPSYDTGDDSIVRVTARDVRKRLNQFYAECELDSGFRVQLPPGSYIPEFRNMPNVFSGEGDKGEKPATDTVLAPARQKSVVWAGLALLLAAAAFALGLQFGHHPSSIAIPATTHGLPWTALIQPNRRVHVIYCDPEIVNIQRFFNFSISLSDYANQHYWPNTTSLSPETHRVFGLIPSRGGTVAEVDAGIALRIAKISALGARFTMDTHTARSVRLADFKTDDSFVLLGSPRSNPWVELFEDQLDFIFMFDSARRSEYVANKHPLKGETSSYVPTAEGWGTGHAYGIIALIGNPDQKGQVLLLAGSNAEATEAAGTLATNLDLLSRVLKSHGIDPDGASRYFEILLRVSTMAGSPSQFEAIACHLLPDKSK